MEFTRDFAIRPKGAIKGGVAGYSVNTLTGDVAYSGDVTVGVWPFSKTLSTRGTNKVSPALLLSSELSQVGHVVIIGKVTFQVMQVGPGHAVVSMAVAGQDWKGSATIDTTGEFWQIEQIVARVRVPILGTLELQADYVPPKPSFWKRLVR